MDVRSWKIEAKNWDGWWRILEESKGHSALSSIGDIDDDETTEEITLIFDMIIGALPHICCQFSIFKKYHSALFLHRIDR